MFLVLYECDKNKQFFILKTDDLTGIEGQQGEYKLFINTDKDIDDIEELFYENLNNSSVSSFKKRGNIGYIVELKNKSDYGYVLHKIINIMTSFINYELQSKKNKKNKNEKPREHITFVIETNSSDESDDTDESESDESDESDESNESNESDESDYIENQFALQMRKKIINRFNKYFKYSKSKKNAYDADMMYKLVSPYKLNNKLKSNLIKKFIKNILEDINVYYDKTSNAFTNVKCLY